MWRKRFTENFRSPEAGGIFRILIDEETSGAKHFSLFVNEMAPGYKGKEHSHDVEHCWYILQGKGIIRMEGKDIRHQTRRCGIRADRDAPHRGMYRRQAPQVCRGLRPTGAGEGFKKADRFCQVMKGRQDEVFS